jgi:Tol biopolymer transport system component
MRTLSRLCPLFFLVLLLSCAEKPGGTAEINSLYPAIFPDYADVTVPVNIAPLNFRVEGDVKSVSVAITGDDGQTLRYRGNKQVRFKQKAWKKLLKGNTGRSLTVEISAVRTEDGQTIARQPFPIHVSSDSIDSHLVYRLIEPGYEKWHIVGIYQRDLESFSEKPIIRNELTGYNCINCHSFCNGNPQQMMLHMRAAYGATYIATNGRIEKLDTRTEHTVSHLTYPYWHPSGRYIVASVNDIKQFFHAVKEKKMEVFDLESDVVVYDLERQSILAAASLLTKDAFETFPSFSPDGQWLYYCSAPAVAMPELYDSIRYGIYRVPFDPKSGCIGTITDTLVRADSHSASFPRISPDGRFLMYTETAYGQFPVWHKDADVRMINLQDGSQADLSLLNSEDTDSYHSWSRNSRWVVISSRRENGLYTLPYFAHIDASGRASKPFLLPQKNPDTYDFLLYSFNLPELVSGEVPLTPYELQHAAETKTATQVGFE